MRKSNLLFLIATQGFCMLPSESNESTHSDGSMQIAQAIRSNLSKLSPAEKGPGFQYCRIDGQGLFCHEEGVADLRTGAPVNRRTTFNAFSVTKTFTSVAIMRLVDQGRMDLDHPIGRYVKAPSYKPEPTLRQILSHTAGLPNPMPMNWVHAAKDHTRFDEAGFIDGILAKHPALKREPGAKFAYSNLGYLLLEKAIEAATSESYAAHLEGALIPALAPGPDDYLSFSIPEGQRHALGSIRRWSLPWLMLPVLREPKRLKDASIGDWCQLQAFHVNGLAYGGLIANASGLARFLQALLQALMAPGLLTPESLAQMLTVQKDRKGDTSMALGWFAGSLDGVPYFTHAGGGGGYYCEIRLYPGSKRASVFMCNRAGIKDERLLDKIDRGAGI